MRRSLLLMLAVSLPLWLAACSVNPVPEPPGPNDTFVFGHIDMEEAPVSLQWVTLRQYAPPTKEPYWQCGVDGGTFYNWYLDPGSYGVDSFGGSGGNARYHFNIPRQDRGMRLKVEKPSIIFLGSYRYINIAGKGFFEPDKFELKEVKSPTEKEVLVKLIKLVKGTPVEPKLQARLKELK